MSTDHLAKAKDYIAKGEDNYRKAAEEIVAAMTENPTLSYVEIGRRIGRSDSWCGKLVRHYTSSTPATDTPFGGADERQRKDQSTARSALRDPDQRRQVIESLEPEVRTELVREVGRSSLPPADRDRDGEREVMRSIADAPEHDVSALAARFVATSSRLDLMLREGGEFKRMDAKELQRLDRDLDQARDTIDRAKEQIAAQSRVRRIA